MYFLSNSNKITVFLILYLSLLVGFYFGENSSGGAYPDFIMRKSIIENFNNEFLITFLNYDNLPDRHSPILLIIISLINQLGIKLDIIRFIHLNLLPLLIFISYKCLSIKYFNINNKILFLICCVFFLSPILRSIAIWPDSRLLGLVLFLFSVYFFLKYQKNLKFKDCILNNVFLIFSAYISPNFSVFFLYFFFYYIQDFKFSKRLMIVIFSNLIMSLPMFYYLFVLDVNFLKTTAIDEVSTLTRINPFNKILIVFSLIFFYIIPLIFRQLRLYILIKDLKLSHTFYSSIFFLCCFYFFDYSINYTGGGIFYKLSYLLFDNSNLFFIVSFLSILLIISIFKFNLNNLLLIIILILSNPQLTIYHKYFDPLLILLFLLFFEFKFSKEKMINKIFVLNIYFFYSIFLILNFGRFFF
tara:strand:+ start:3077 stop:4318 length:1242 start_codon:yes stop_codon:yes gene_type:complete